MTIAFDLEREVVELRRRLDALDERVRICGVAERFVDDRAEIRAGDYFLLYPDRPTQLCSISSEGKWTYHDGRNTITPHQVPEPGEYERLYTRAEVQAIVEEALDRRQEALDLVDEA